MTWIWATTPEGRRILINLARAETIDRVNDKETTVLFGDKDWVRVVEIPMELLDKARRIIE